MFGVCLLVFIGLCIYHASEKELPADYHKNWRLEQEDADKVRYGEMSKREFIMWQVSQQSGNLTTIHHHKDRELIIMHRVMIGL